MIASRQERTELRRAARVRRNPIIGIVRFEFVILPTGELLSDRKTTPFDDPPTKSLRERADERMRDLRESLALIEHAAGYWLGDQWVGGDDASV